ncbi:MAG: MerR family transcriptional regulator [Candidatus Omnitrophica bacterium]|nr:MerR family transcriptional regulator [Candidatus Omnitrophota bacterium]MDD5310326.1 MerR family transcriptional regulator [Candidatus Omnitrophota bacterium]MDD5545871.1 MerR family transcriptional regulator [Candidatus Omnitrophota bacterium]
MSAHNLYLVKDLARLTGLSIETVKYYLKIRLISEVGRSPETNFRYFDESTINRLNRIISLRRDKYPIKKILELLEPGRASS